MTTAVFAAPMLPLPRIAAASSSSNRPLATMPRLRIRLGPSLALCRTVFCKMKRSFMSVYIGHFESFHCGISPQERTEV